MFSVGLPVCDVPVGGTLFSLFTTQFFFSFLQVRSHYTSSYQYSFRQPFTSIEAYVTDEVKFPALTDSHRSEFTFCDLFNFMFRSLSHYKYMHFTVCDQYLLPDQKHDVASFMTCDRTFTVYHRIFAAFG